MKVLILANAHVGIYNQRKELIDELFKQGYEVYISYPDEPSKQYFIDKGCKFIDVKLSRRGKNPIGDLRLLKQYKRMIKEIRPNVILSYTIKPNIYGSIAARKYNIPIICNVTGLGTAVEKKSILQFITFKLYRYSLKSANHVFAQSQANLDFLVKHRLVKRKLLSLLPGSGVNLKEFAPTTYPSTKVIKFAFISRIMKEKGIDNYLIAAKYLKRKYSNVVFYVAGFFEQDYEDIIDEYVKEGIIEYKGMLDDTRDIYIEIHCLVHPTYYPEGLSNVLLESSASARPIITTNRSGCKEVVDDNINGFIVNIDDTLDLICQMEKFILLDDKEKKNMGLNARLKVERQFSRDIVISEYFYKMNAFINDENVV